MGTNTSSSTNDDLASFTDMQVQAGGHDSASKIVRAGSTPLEEHEAKVKMLHNALIASENSGPPAPFDNQAFLQRMRAKHTP